VRPSLQAEVGTRWGCGLAGSAAAVVAPSFSHHTLLGLPLLMMFYDEFNCVYIGFL